MRSARLDSPIGELLLRADGAGLREILFEQAAQRAAPERQGAEGAEAIAETAAQLRAYFAGRLRDFDLPLAPAGTEFQLEVWHALARIPFGTTTTYGELAAQLGRPAASRAVGAANGRNPLPIVLPCHRVVGSDGSLTGFGGGLPTKRFLLEHEGVALDCRGVPSRHRPSRHRPSRHRQMSDQQQCLQFLKQPAPAPRTRSRTPRAAESE